MSLRTHPSKYLRSWGKNNLNIFELAISWKTKFVTDQLVLKLSQVDLYFLHKIVSYLRYSVPKSHVTQLTHEELLT